MHAWIGLDTDKSMFEDYGVTSIPHTVIVDQKGIIAAITHPTYLTEEHLKDLLAGKNIALAPPATTRSEREALFQVIIQPSKTAGPSSSSSFRGSLALSRATVLDVLSSSYRINPARIVTRALHEQLGLELAPAVRAVNLLVVTVANRQVSQSEVRARK